MTAINHRPRARRPRPAGPRGRDGLTPLSPHRARSSPHAPAGRCWTRRQCVRVRSPSYHDGRRTSTRAKKKKRDRKKKEKKPNTQAPEQKRNNAMKLGDRWSVVRCAVGERLSNQLLGRTLPDPRPVSSRSNNNYEKKRPRWEGKSGLGCDRFQSASDVISYRGGVTAIYRKELAGGCNDDDRKKCGWVCGFAAWAAQTKRCRP